MFVSHRLSSATTANKIVVLNNGTIEEIGNHSELMKLRGEYYKLFSTQARRYHAPIEDEIPPHSCVRDQMTEAMAIAHRKGNLGDRRLRIKKLLLFGKNQDMKILIKKENFLSQ